MTHYFICTCNSFWAAWLPAYFQSAYQPIRGGLTLNRERRSFFFFNDFYNPLSLPSPALPVLPFPISFLLAPLTPPSSSSLLSSSSSLARHCFLSLSASTHQSPSALCVDAFSQPNSITSEHVQPPHTPPPHLCSLHHHHLSLGS